jgi:replication-associated recombination protein RarA
MTERFEGPAAQRSARYEARTKHGYPLDEVTSALQKCIRRAQVDEAMYWAVEMNESGFGAYAWRRLIVICSEDVGPADHMASVVIHALHENSKVLREAVRSGSRAQSDYWKALWPYEALLQAVTYLARAPKSREMCDAYPTIKMRQDKGDLLPIPDYALDTHTKRGRSMGRGMEHFRTEASKLIPHKEVEGDPWRKRFDRERPKARG